MSYNVNFDIKTDNYYRLTIPEVNLDANDNNLPKTKKIEQICKIYQQIIKLEISRPPVQLLRHVKYNWEYHADGTSTLIETEHYEEDNTNEKIEMLYDHLVKKLDIYTFMQTLDDDIPSYNQIKNLMLQWEDAAQSTFNGPNDNEIGINLFNKMVNIFRNIF